MAKDTFWLNRPTGQDEGELMAQFLRRYYTDNEDIPKELMVSTLPAEQELIEEWLHSVTGHKVSIKVPQRGDKRSLLDMMMENAHLLFQERYEAESRQQAVLIHYSTGTTGSTGAHRMPIHLGARKPWLYGGLYPSS